MNPLFTSHVITTTSHGTLSSGKIILNNDDIANRKVKPPKNEMRCDGCHTILNGTCLVVMDRGTPIHYFCDKRCKKDYVRVNGNF